MNIKFKIFRLKEEQNVYDDTRYTLVDAGYLSGLEFEYIVDAEDQLKYNVLFDEKYVILKVYSVGKIDGENYDK